MSPLYFLLVIESFVIGWMWHNQSARFERKHESEKPDPAVLFSRIPQRTPRRAPRCRETPPRAAGLHQEIKPHEC